VPLFIQILNSTIQSFPKVTGGEVMSRTANSTLNDAESIAKKMNEFVSIEHLVLAILTLKVKGQILKDRVTEKD
jgi:ATP-dependent Clp protease ATP-binding subunit ClpB